MELMAEICEHEFDRQCSERMGVGGRQCCGGFYLSSMGVCTTVERWFT